MKQLTAILTPIFILILVGIYLIAHDTVLLAAKAIILMIVMASGLVLLAIIAFVFYYVKIAHEKAAGQKEKTLTEREHRLKASREIVTHEGQILIRELDKNATWIKAHAVPNWRINGKAVEPTQLELDTFQAHLQRNRKQEPLMIEGQTIEQQKQLRSVFDLLNEGVHLALIGPTDSGKTTLANHLIDCLQANVTYALDPHAKFNIWSSCCQVVDSYLAIEEQLAQLLAEMDRRYEAGPDDYESILIVIDEWPAIVETYPKSAEYLKRLSREGRKVDMRLILLSQSDLIQDIGTNISIRNNFLKIGLSQELMWQNQAVIWHWNKDEEIIMLAGPYNLTKEQRIVAAWNQTNGNLVETTKQIYSHDGGNQRDRIRQVLRENGLYEEKDASQ